MIRIGVEYEDGGYQAVVVNQKTGYRVLGRSFQATTAMSPAEQETQRQRAFVDAQDWAVKFLTAGLSAEVAQS